MTLSLSTVRTQARQTQSRPTLMTYLAIWSERRALSRLSPATLRDIGVSQGQAAREIARPVWDIAGTARE